MSERTSGAPSRDVLLTLVERNLRLRAKRAWLGTVWPVVAPFLLAVLYVFVFRSVFRVPVERYPDFLLCGLLPWAFLAITVGRAISSISSEPELVRKIGRRQELLPISVVLGNTVNLVATMVLFVGFLAVQGDLPWSTLPLVVLPLAATVLLVSSVSLIVALVDVYNHDLNQVLPNLLTIWFFLVPIVYRPRMAPDSVQFLQSVDPMNLIVGQMRSVLYFGNVDEPIKMAVMVVLTAVLFVGSLAFFRRFAADLPKDV